VALAADPARLTVEVLQKGGLVLGTERTRASEEYRVTVERILRLLRSSRAGRTGAANLLMITSARPGEGKTFSALNLATSIVQNGLAEVLLVDVDGAPRSLSTLLGLRDRPGLMELAADPGRPIETLLTLTALPGLAVLPIGAVRPGAEPGVTGAVNVAIEQLGRRFPHHVVVFDTPPCLSTSDPSALAARMDAVVVVVEAESTRRTELETSLELLRACPNVSVLLNKIQLVQRHAFGGYYHAGQYGIPPPPRKSRLQRLLPIWRNWLRPRRGGAPPLGLFAALACCLAAGAGPHSAPAQEVGEAGAPAAPAPALQPTTSLLQSGPPQPGGTGGGTGLLAVPGQSLSERIAAGLGGEAPAPATQPAVTFTPAITVQQGWTSNASNTSGGSSGQFFTEVTPSLAVSADTMRVQAHASYAPSLVQYEPDRGQSQVGQNFSAQAHAILVPETVFLDAAGFAGLQTITGGAGPPGSLALGRQDSAQDYSFSLSPYLQHRFADWGTAELGGTLGQTAQIVPQGVAIAALPGLPATPLSDQHATSTEEHLVFLSGEAFGRWLSQAVVSATQFSGTGVLDGAHRELASYEAGYAVTHTIALLATIGWQDIFYSGTPAIRVEDVLWNVGLRLTPNPDSSITVRYGRTDGIDAAFLDGVYAPSARTRFTAHYAVTLSTDQEQLSRDLASATLDAFGTPVNATTGLPLLATNDFIGLSGGVYRLEAASASGALLLDRDTFVLALTRQRQTPLNQAAGQPVPIAARATYGSFSWQHNLSEAVQATFYLQYGVDTASAEGILQTSNVLVCSAALGWALSPTLTAQLLYSHTQSTFRAPFPAASADLVMVGATKTF
jgi:uncharacterized protein (PEP-CTERM system associated)